MQYVNGFDVSAQTIAEIIAINDKVKLRKVSEQDGVISYEKATESHYVAKCQGIISVPAEYAYDQFRHADYGQFLPGCMGHQVVEKYNFNNEVILTRLRTPSLEGRSVEYCAFLSCYANYVKRLFVVSFRGIKHDQVQFSEECFELIVNDPHLKNIPLILETEGPYDAEISLLYSMLK